MCKSLLREWWLWEEPVEPWRNKLFIPPWSNCYTLLSARLVEDATPPPRPMPLPFACNPFHALFLRLCSLQPLVRYGNFEYGERNNTQPIQTRLKWERLIFHWYLSQSEFAKCTWETDTNEISFGVTELPPARIMGRPGVCVHTYWVSSVSWQVCDFYVPKFHGMTMN